MNATMLALGVERERDEIRQPILFGWSVSRIRELNALAVRFRLNERARVTLEVEPLNSGFSKVLFDAPQPAGEFTEGWRMTGSDGRPVAPGVYQITLSLNGAPVADSLIIQD